jgi:hypothetical protein
MRRGIVSRRKLATDAASPQPWSSLTFYSAVRAARDARCALAPDASQHRTRSRRFSAQMFRQSLCAAAAHEAETTFLNVARADGGVAALHHYSAPPPGVRLSFTTSRRQYVLCSL